MKAEPVRWVGDDALAIDTDSCGLRQALCHALMASGRWIEVVPGKRDIVVRFDPLQMGHDEASALLANQQALMTPEPVAPGPIVELTMDCDPRSAPDLASLCDANALRPDAFLEKLTRSALRVDILGFMPGFAYIDGLDPSFRADRLASPRARLMAGSVGMLTGQLGLYALPGPGGWPIIGRVREPLFRPDQQSPFVLQPGVRLRLSANL